MVATYVATATCMNTDRHTYIHTYVHTNKAWYYIATYIYVCMIPLRCDLTLECK